jgi:N-acetylgalactosamine-N,N'-diacetylbacillosaminyl-diphospho-undecaprenol 4-alpha-N-acetylgalactosaminyltransferase
MKNINIIINSLSAGGAERIVSTLLYELTKEYNVTLVLMNSTIFYKIPDNIKIVYLENVNLNENGLVKLVKLPFLAYKYLRMTKNVCITLSFLVRPNYINIISKFYGSKSKVIITELSMPSLQHMNGVQGLINRLLMNLLYKKADSIVANSIGNSFDLKKNFSVNKVKTIYSPININSIMKDSIINVDFRDECFTFITVGRLDYGKNHSLLINAMREINAKLYIIGDGNLRFELDNQIKEFRLENKVFLLGNQSNPYKYLRQADCFVFSSLREGLPTVLLEALACGLPIISSDCPSGPREILAPGTNLDIELSNTVEYAEFGILIPVANKDKLVEAMTFISNNNNIKIHYSNKAINRAFSFDIENIAKQYHDLFNSVT